MAESYSQGDLYPKAVKAALATLQVILNSAGFTAVCLNRRRNSRCLNVPVAGVLHQLLNLAF